MKAILKKKLEKAVNFIREVHDDIEAEGAEDLDNFGSRLEDLAVELDDILEEIERGNDEDTVDDRFQVE